MRRLISVTLIALFAGLVLAACADNDRRAEDGRFNGFYGGVIGGSAP